jgi:cellulose synthase/poly-beta-1,6-N-acetylglucosamine synthase-like glycosyltransferase
VSVVALRSGDKTSKRARWHLLKAPLQDARAEGATRLSITVLVPTFRRPAHLRRCLLSLAAQDRPSDEVIVVVRQGDEETRRVLQQLGSRVLDVRCITVSVPGVVAALTAGLDAVGTDVVAITDDDVVAPSDWLARVESHFRSAPAVGAVGGRDRVHKGDRWLDGERREVGHVHWYGRVVGNHHLGAGPPRAVDILKGANMSLRMAALDGIRPDPHLLGHGAQAHFEVGLCLALARRKWTVLYDPSVKVHHYSAPRFDDDSRDRPTLRALADETHNQLYLLLRWLPVWRRPIVLAYALLIGYRRTPGLAVFAERLVRERSRDAITARFLAAERGRLRALRTALEERGPGPARWRRPGC